MWTLNENVVAKQLMTLFVDGVVVYILVTVDSSCMYRFIVLCAIVRLCLSCADVPRDGQRVTNVSTPDPHVFRISDTLYLLTATEGRVLTSQDGCTDFVSIGPLWNHDADFSDMWAPQVARIAGKVYLTTTGRRASCTGDAVSCRTVWWTPLDGVYSSIRTSSLRPFVSEIGCGGPVPRSGQTQAPLYRMGLDSDLWEDPQTGEAWLSWSTDYADRQQHVGIARVDPKTLAVLCDSPALIRPFENLSLLEQDRNMTSYVCSFPGIPWLCTPGFTASATGRHVYEAPSLMRRGEWIYLFFSASDYRSDKYGVFFLAARSVRELADPTTRLRGQYVPPTVVAGTSQVFGHGRPFQATGGRWFFSMHRNNAPNAVSPRLAWIAPITFVDKGDGLGDVWIRPIQPIHAWKEQPAPGPPSPPHLSKDPPGIPLKIPGLRLTFLTSSLLIAGMATCGCAACCVFLKFILCFGRPRRRPASPQRYK